MFHTTGKGKDEGEREKVQIFRRWISKGQEELKTVSFPWAMQFLSPFLFLSLYMYLK